jgi:hypothetical protein
MFSCPACGGYNFNVSTFLFCAAFDCDWSSVEEMPATFTTYVRQASGS